MDLLKLLEVIFSGPALAFIGATLAAALAGAGSAKGVGISGEAAAGVLTENPTLFSKVLILQALPGTQGIYGMLTWFMVMINGQFLGGGAVELTTAQGLQFFAACVPMMITGYISAIYQGRVSASGCALVARKPEQLTKAIVLAAMVETYAILALLVSVLTIFSIEVG